MRKAGETVAEKHNPQDGRYYNQVRKGLLDSLDHPRTHMLFILSYSAYLDIWTTAYMSICQTNIATHLLPSHTSGERRDSTP